MADWAIFRDELQTLSDVTHELAVAADCAQCLDGVATKIGALVPFERCVLLHERGRGRGCASMRYAFSDVWEAGGRTDAKCSEVLTIGRYLDHFRKGEVFQHAFFWSTLANDTAKASGAPDIADFIARTRLGQGVAGAVTSVDGERGEVTTLIQLQFAAERYDAKQLFFVNIIVSYLHTYLVHAGASLCSSDAKRTLTSKEREVLQWIVEGKTSWEVGRILSMSERTVKFHLKNIYTKLNVANRAQAVTMASRMRLI